MINPGTDEKYFGINITVIIMQDIQQHTEHIQHMSHRPITKYGTCLVNIESMWLYLDRVLPCIEFSFSIEYILKVAFVYL